MGGQANLKIDHPFLIRTPTPAAAGSVPDLMYVCFMLYPALYSAVYGRFFLLQVKDNGPIVCQAASTGPCTRIHPTPSAAAGQCGQRLPHQLDAVGAAAGGPAVGPRL